MFQQLPFRPLPCGTSPPEKYLFINHCARCNNITTFYLDPDDFDATYESETCATCEDHICIPDCGVRADTNLTFVQRARSVLEILPNARLLSESNTSETHLECSYTSFDLTWICWSCGRDDEWRSNSPIYMSHRESVWYCGTCGYKKDSACVGYWKAEAQLKGVRGEDELRVGDMGLEYGMFIFGRLIFDAGRVCGERIEFG